LDDPYPYLTLALFLGILKPFSIGILFSLLVLIVLLFFSALISASEVAFFSLTPSERDILNASDSTIHLLIKKLLATPKALLATILISNNFINVSIIILSNDIINSMFDLSTIPDWLNFSIQVVGITFVILLFGEVIPKVYATKHALKMAKMMGKPISLLKKIFKPIIKL